MSTKYFIGLFVFFILISSVSAEIFLNNRTWKDDFNNGLINQSLWLNYTNVTNVLKSTSFLGELGNRVKLNATIFALVGLTESGNSHLRINNINYNNSLNYRYEFWMNGSLNLPSSKQACGVFIEMNNDTTYPANYATTSNYSGQTLYWTNDTSRLNGLPKKYYVTLETDNMVKLYNSTNNLLSSINVSSQVTRKLGFRTGCSSNAGADNGAFAELNIYNFTTTYYQPINNYGSVSLDYFFNSSVIKDNSATLVNASIVVYNSGGSIINKTLNLVDGRINETSWNINLPLGTYSWNIIMNDDEYVFDSNLTLSSGITINSQTYNSTTITTSNEGFSLNATINSTYTITSSYFHYNNTAYAVTPSTVDGNKIFTKSLTTPLVTTSTNKNFFWEINLFDGSNNININTTALIQTINPLVLILVNSTACPAGYNTSYIFSFADEQTRIGLNSNVSWNFQYGLSSITSSTSAGNLSNITNLYVCINTTTQTYQVNYGEVRYTPDNYITRSYYLFSGARLTAIPTNTTLYSLLGTEAVTFLFTVTDTQYREQAGFYLALLRWYPDINSYTLAEMGLTDNKGQTPLRVEIDDTDYRIAVYNQNGTLVKLYDPVRFVCTTSPCSYSVFVPIDSSELVSVSSLQTSLTFNDTTKTFVYIWNDISQQTSLMNLTVFQDSAGGTSVLCSSSTTGFSGMLTCDVSSYSGTVRAMVWRTASPTILIMSMIRELGQKLTDIAGGKTIGLFVSFILFTFSFLAGIFNPVVGIILGIASLGISVYLGAISGVVLLGLFLLGMLIIHFMRRS